MALESCEHVNQPPRRVIVAPGKVRPRAERLQFTDEGILLKIVRHDRRQWAAVLAGRVNADPAIGVNDALPEDNRGDVTFAGRA